MKLIKRLIIVVLLLVSVNSYSQTNHPELGLSMGYGFDKCMNGEFEMRFNKSFSIIAGFDIYLSEPVGEYYHTINWDEFYEDIYNEGKKNNYNFYVGVGKTLNKFTFKISFEALSTYKYRERFDRTHTLGNNGYYNTKVSDKVYYGVRPAITYNVYKFINTTLAYSKNVGLVISVGVIFPLG